MLYIGFLQGVQLLETCRVKDATEEKKMSNALLLLYMNASLCSLKLGQGARAKKYARKVIDPLGSSTKRSIQYSYSFIV